MLPEQRLGGDEAAADLRRAHDVERPVEASHSTSASKVDVTHSDPVVGGKRESCCGEPPQKGTRTEST